MTGVQAQTRGERGEQMKATVASIINANVNVRFQVNTLDMLDYPLRDFFADFVALSMMDKGPIAVTAQEWARISEAQEFDKFALVPHLESYVGQGAQKFQMMGNMMQFMMGVTAPEGIGEHVKVMYASRSSSSGPRRRGRDRPVGAGRRNWPRPRRRGRRFCRSRPGVGRRHSPA